MKQYTTVEDYLEVISGLKDPVTLKKNHNSWLIDFDPIINLARYDTDVLNSMSTAASEGRALTEKQGELAVKIVLKYKRQLAGKDIDVTPVENPQWRLSLRRMDYTRSITLVNDTIVVEFPFSNALIESLRDFRKESQGRGEWNKDKKQWSFALTEYNLVWLYTWAEQNQFKIDPAVVKLNALIVEAEKTPYNIELVRDGEQMTITNCPDSLHTYILEHGGFGFDNIVWLVDNSKLLGYTVSQDLVLDLAQTTGSDFSEYMLGQEFKISPADMPNSALAKLLDYADSVQRWPVVIYEPDLSGRLLTQLKTLREGVVEVARTVKVNERYWDNGFRYVHVVTPVTNKQIPLLISTAGMMYGGDKNLMIQNSQKILYCVSEVYPTKENNNIKQLK